MISFTEMSESELPREDIDNLDNLENSKEGNSMMQCDSVKRDFNEANIDDPVSFLPCNNEKHW